MQKGHSVGVFSKTSNFEPVHMHEFIEIIFAKFGSAVERIDDVDYHVKRGDIFQYCKDIPAPQADQAFVSAWGVLSP